MSDKPRPPLPVFPPNRIIREDESVWCRTCGSGRHAHRHGGERADHLFDPLPGEFQVEKNFWTLAGITVGVILWPVILWWLT